MRKRDVLSTSILIILIISAAMLTVKVWAFDSGMLSSPSELSRIFSRLQNGIKYGFFVDAYDFQSENDNFESSLIYPSKMVFGDGENLRLMPPYDSNVRDTVNQAAKDIISYVITDESAQIAKSVESDMREALNGSSVYFDYGYTLDFGLYAEYLGIITNRLSQYDGFDTVTISYGDTLTVYFYNSNTKETISISALQNERTANLYSMLWSQRPSFLECSFGYELGKTLSFEIGDYAVLPSVQMNTAQLSVSKYIHNDMDSQEKRAQAEKVLKLFGFSRSSGRWYDSDSSLSYISDDATLNLLYDGFIEYRALNPQRGFTPNGVSDMNVLDRGQVISTAASLISSVRTAVMQDNVTHVSFAGMEQNKLTGTVRVYFDYAVNGVSFYKSGAVKGYAAVVDINDRGEVAYAKIMSDSVNYMGNNTNTISRESLFNIIEINKYTYVADFELLYSEEKNDGSYAAKWSLMLGGMA